VAVLEAQEVGPVGQSVERGESDLSPSVSTAGPTERSLSQDLEEACAGDDV
jgi:hypothetical protein